jgi:hypothetical protein
VKTTFRGVVTATAFVLDVPVIGVAEARRRVVDWWSDGARVHVLPTGAWLLVLNAPVEVRAEHAPGLPLATPDSGIPVAGKLQHHQPGELPLADFTGWVDLDGFTVRHLTPADEPLPDPVEPTSSIPARRGMREVAKIGRPSRNTENLFAEPKRGSRLLGSIAELLTRGAYQRYLDRLTDLFQRKSWTEALREAIALSGEDGGQASPGFRTPRPRTGTLKPTPLRTPGGRTIMGAPGDHVQLSTLYQTAAEELEKVGRINEAAFVYADLLNDPGRAVALLERHERFAPAAELAEGRELAPDLVVRLWWKAGNRERAVDVARARGAFPAAIQFLSRVDKAAAVRLRREWVADRQRSSDHLGAVAAAWPAPDLRHLVLVNVQHGMALGGANAAHLLAYLVSEWPTEQTRATALALLDSEALTVTRERFVSTLLTLTAKDPVSDRILCTAALRAMQRDRKPALAKKLVGRSDPLAAADLPPITALQPSTGPLELHAPAEPGELPIHDAVRLDGGAILVAHGDLGARLLTVDGRVRAQWSVPAHQLVVADHGGCALLVAHYGEVSEVHELNLSSRKVRRWTTVRGKRFLPSYDGSLAIVLDEDGLAFLDTHAEHPKIVWRELGSEDVVRQIVRSPTSLAALVNNELWRWDLPSMTLRKRERKDEVVGAIVASGFYHFITDARIVSGDLIAVITGPDTFVHRGQADLTVVFTNLAAAGFRSHADTVTVWDNHNRLMTAELS